MVAHFKKIIPYRYTLETSVRLQNVHQNFGISKQTLITPKSRMFSGAKLFRVTLTSMRKLTPVPCTLNATSSLVCYDVMYSDTDS